MRAFVIVHGQADLLHIINALGAASRFTSRLHRREEQRDQHGDDCDDDQ